MRNGDLKVEFLGIITEHLVSYGFVPNAEPIPEDSTVSNPEVKLA